MLQKANNIRNSISTSVKDRSTEYEAGLAMKIDIVRIDIPFRQN